MNLNNLNKLVYFCTLAKLKHYVEAAEELQISLPALDQAMASLEEEIGTELFERDGRSVTLTKNGVIYLDHIKTALGRISEVL